jgi:tetratricopeptide (TPR) repeat protein
VKTHTRMSLVLALLVCLAALPATLLGQGQQQQQQQQKQQQQPQQQQEQPQQPQVDPELEAAQNVLQAATPQEQVELAEQFLEKYPESTYRAHVLMAAAGAHRMLNHMDKAIEYGKRALELNPRDAISMLLVADALSEGAKASAPDYEQRLDQAEDYSRQALDLLPQLFQSVQRRPDVPEEQYKMREDYMLAQAHATLGYIYLRREQLPAAEQELRMATELNQLRPNAADYERLGVTLMEQKKYQEASEAFRSCADYGGPAFENCHKRLEFVEGELKKQSPAPGTPQPPATAQPPDTQPPAEGEQPPLN